MRGDKKYFLIKKEWKKSFNCFKGNFGGEGVRKKIFVTPQMNPPSVSYHMVGLILAFKKPKKMYMHIGAYVHYLA